MIYNIIKRFFDIVLSICALVILSPLFIIASIGIIVSSPGPIFYKANRIGKNKSPFKMYKFRSMYLNNEKGHSITLRSDSRIFPFGRFLRKTKIDELPQLINILKGEMSIVGPRPEDEENVAYVFVGEYEKILSKTPGLTSPGSLYDYTHGEMYESEEMYNKEFLPIKLKMELLYVNNMSLLYDIELILRTIIIIIQVILGKTAFKLPKEYQEIDLGDIK